jgi:uncharacterized protein (TIGR00369 family)
MLTHAPIDAAVLRATPGLRLLQMMIDGELPRPPINETLGFHLAKVERGLAEFHAVPLQKHLNPIGSIHGGFAATILDSAMACAIHSELDAGQTYTTIEFKITFIRGMTPDTGAIRCIGRAINVGRRLGVAEGEIVDANGKVLAHGTTSCMIFTP